MKHKQSVDDLVPFTVQHFAVAIIRDLEFFLRRLSPKTGWSHQNPVPKGSAQVEVIEEKENPAQA